MHLMDLTHRAQHTLGINDTYACLLAGLSLSFRFPTPPPDLVRECIFSVVENPQDLPNSSVNKQCFDAPVNLCIRDQKPKSAFVSVHPRSPSKVNSLAPEAWRVPIIPSTCNVSAIPQKVKENAHLIPPTRRRAGWKGLSVCAACFRSFSKMSDLNQHYLQDHKDLLDRAWTEAITKRQRRCCKTFDRRRLPCHLTQIHKGNLTGASGVDTLVHSFSQSLTDSCDRLKAEKSTRKGHICPWCNYCAKWPTELQKHVVVHANSRPYACIICNNCYKWSWDLGRHFSTVHAGLPNPYKMNKKSIRTQLQRAKVDSSSG